MAHLKHHGIKGQKWGVRRFQNKDGSLTAEGRKHYNKGSNINELLGPKDKSYNLDKWGTSPDNNLLIIAGLSGSGKSTLARNLKNTNDAIRIELDLYYENPKKDYNHDKSKAFNKYLNEKVPEYNKIINNFDAYDEVRFPEFDKNSSDSNHIKMRKEYWNTMDKVRDALFNFSKEQYGKHKVIAEGVQFLDSTMYPDINDRRKVLKNNPSIIKQTGVVRSTLKGILRDNVSFIDIPTVATRFKFNKNWNKNIKDLTFDL